MRPVHTMHIGTNCPRWFPLGNRREGGSQRCTHWPPAANAAANCNDSASPCSPEVPRRLRFSLCGVVRLNRPPQRRRSTAPVRVRLFLGLFDGRARTIFGRNRSRVRRRNAFRIHALRPRQEINVGDWARNSRFFHFGAMTGKPSESEQLPLELVELHPDAWDRLRQAVHVMAKAGPQHRINGVTVKKQRPASKGRVHKGKSRA